MRHCRVDMELSHFHNCTHNAHNLRRHELIDWISKSMRRLVKPRVGAAPDYCDIDGFIFSRLTF